MPGDSRRRDGAVRVLVTAAVLGGLVVFLGLTGPDNGWNWGRIWGHPRYREVIGRGLLLTFELSLAALVISLVAGLAGGLARMSRHAWLQQLGTIYVEVVRGTPLLVQLFVAVYCFGYAVGLTGDDDALYIGTVTLGVFAGAYVSEIVRAAVQSVDPGQTEAALSQGMTRAQAMRHVLLPQALRRMLPPMTGEFVSLVKDSSLLSAIGVLEVTKRAREAGAETQQTFEVLLPLAVMYLAITFPLSRLARRLELRTAA